LGAGISRRWPPLAGRELVQQNSESIRRRLLRDAVKKFAQFSTDMRLQHRLKTVLIPNLFVRIRHPI